MRHTTMLQLVIVRLDETLSEKDIQCFFLLCMLSLSRKVTFWSRGGNLVKGPNEQLKSTNSPAYSYMFLHMSTKQTASIFVSRKSAATLASSQSDVADRRT